jgi:hypothetical protein
VVTGSQLWGVLSVSSVLLAVLSFCAVAEWAGVPLALGLILAVLSLWRPEVRRDASPWLSQLSFLFALVSVGSLVFASWNLLLHPGPRWVHRFAIYSGYSAVFGTLATLARRLALRFQGQVPWTRVGTLFLAIYVLGSLGIYFVKEQAVRCHPDLHRRVDNGSCLRTRRPGTRASRVASRARRMPRG